MPSAELLFLNGESQLEHVAEEISADWTKCSYVSAGEAGTGTGGRCGYGCGRGDCTLRRSARGATGDSEWRRVTNNIALYDLEDIVAAVLERASGSPVEGRCLTVTYGEC